jgi:hypothetical protein
MPALTHPACSGQVGVRLEEAAASGAATPKAAWPYRFLPKQEIKMVAGIMTRAARAVNATRGTHRCNSPREAGVSAPAAREA